jgi:hypothetical protein
MEAANSTVNFYQASPPNYRRESPQMGLSVTTHGFVNTQGNERARIPKRGRFLHSCSSLSARTACIALFPVTLPVGILKFSFTSSRTLGRRSFPAATRPSSWSSALSAKNGTSLATGRLLQGAALNSQAATAAAQEYDAKALLLQSQLDYSEAHDEFIHAMGRTPE